MNRQAIFRIVLVLLFLTAVGLPLASAATQIVPLPVQEQANFSAQDNPELIGALKDHVADLAGSQKARMDGVISYVNTISGGPGAADLQTIQEDYLATATSIPLMETADEIGRARTEMGDLTREFSEETNAQMQIFNGSTADLRSSINASIASAGESVDGVKSSAWLASDAARLQVFDITIAKRDQLLTSLEKQGVDVSAARNVSDLIEAQRTMLVDALKNHNTPALLTMNTDIKSLNQQFRDDVAAYQAELAIQLKVAALASGS